MIRRRIITGKSLRSTDPEVAHPVLENPPDIVIGKAIFTAVMHMMYTLSRLPVKKIQSSPVRPHPAPVLTILEDGMHFITPQAPGLVFILPVLDQKLLNPTLPVPPASIN